MKRFIVKKEQLVEYLETKKADKLFYEIVEQLYLNTKLLNENISNKKLNQSIINNYNRKGLISLKLFEMLTKYKIINDNYDIL